MDKIQEVKDRVGRIVAERGLSYNSISLKLGRNPTYLQKFVKEKSPKRLDEKFRKDLACLLQVNEQELTDIDLGRTNVIQLPPKQSTESLIDEQLLMRIINRVELWEDENDCEFEPKDKAKLIKVIYLELRNEKSPHEQQEKQMGKIIDFFKKVVGE